MQTLNASASQPFLITVLGRMVVIPSRRAERGRAPPGVSSKHGLKMGDTPHLGMHPRERTWRSGTPDPCSSAEHSPNQESVTATYPGGKNLSILLGGRVNRDTTTIATLDNRITTVTAMMSVPAMVLEPALKKYSQATAVVKTEA
ncbi:hypothetical protein APED_09995 [Acanthopleuribacter pedis]